MSLDSLSGDTLLSKEMGNGGRDIDLVRLMLLGLLLSVKYHIKSVLLREKTSDWLSYLFITSIIYLTLDIKS